MADMNDTTDRIDFPEFDSLDPAMIEFYLDVDLDQLTVLFYGRHRRHSANPRNPVLSVLEDPTTNEVLGISLDRFAKQVLVEHPDFIAMAAAATILAGDEIIPPGEFFRFPIEQPLPARLAGSFRTARQAWSDAGQSEPATRQIFASLMQFA